MYRRQTRSVSGAGEPNHLNGKCTLRAATGLAVRTRFCWNNCLEIQNQSLQQLVAKHSYKWQLISQLQIEETHYKCNTMGEQEHQVREVAISNSQPELVSLRKEHPWTELSDHQGGRPLRKIVMYGKTGCLLAKTALHEQLAAQMNQLLRDGTRPMWLTEGQTVLIQKDPSYIIATKRNGHMDPYMRKSWKSVGKDTREVKH